MRTRLFQLHVEPGQPSANVDQMLAAIADAKAAAIDLICFPEMAIPGYLLGDEWERDSFLRDCELAGQRVCEAADGITVIFGNIAVDWQRKNEDGRVRKYNALFIAENSQWLTHSVTGLPYFIKFLMPNYREFDDHRHFYDPRKLAPELEVAVADLIAPAKSRLGRLGCILCEDGWDEDYNLSPLQLLKQQAADLIVNISSSPYTFNKNHKRHRIFAKHAASHHLPLYYINCTGLQDNAKTLFTFDGGTCAYDKNGNVLGEVEAFSQGFLDVALTATATVTSAPKLDSIATQFAALEFGMQNFLARIGLNKVVIGVSGGIDSAVAAALYRRILPADNLLLVSMPGPYTSNTTKKLAAELAANLGCYFTEIPIDAAVSLTEQQLNMAEFQRSDGARRQLEVSDFVRENIQARDRSARILAAVAAAFGGGFSCNANKSEMTVGYSTLYGDLGGFLACLADLWKHEVYELAHFLNNQVYHREAIPQGSINVVPSAELSLQQNVDQGQGDPLFYPYHDRLFQSWVERWARATPEDNLHWYLEGRLAAEIGYEGNIEDLFADAQAFILDLERWWNLYQGMAIAKRIQAPPVLAVKRRAFGFDHREAQLGPRYSQGYQRLKQAALTRATSRD